MDLKLDPYTIGGVVAISAGGYLIIKAYNNYGAVSVWNSIGMVTIGSESNRFNYSNSHTKSITIQALVSKC